MAEEKKTEHINLKVLGQDNAIVQFKIKRHTPLRKLMVAYCERTSLAKEAVRFRFDGAPLNELDTPERLEMEEGDTIEVYQPQTGGFNSFFNNFNHNPVSNCIAVMLFQEVYSDKFVKLKKM